jgi:hypothetical protein
VVLWGAGRTGRRLARLLLDRVELAAFIDIDPRKIGTAAASRSSPRPPADLLGREAVVLAAVASRGRGLIGPPRGIGLVERAGF